MKNCKIRTLSNWSVAITVILALLCVAVSAAGFRKYEVLRGAMEDYIFCEQAARELQSGSDVLTKQVRLAAATGRQRYIDAYFEEANVTRSREEALETLKALHGDPDAIEPLERAMSASVALMQTEYYSMRLVEEAIHADPARWPEEVRAVELSQKDAVASDSEKLDRAQDLLISPEYEKAKDEITGDVNAALTVLTSEILDRQHRATDVFAEIFRTIVLCVWLFAGMMLLECMVIRHGIVKPLLEYNESIRHGKISPIRGVAELRTLAETYNSVYEENGEREMLMKHQAEYDAMTELLNRRSFDQILDLYAKDQNRFALILADIDMFKNINDSCGHAAGDQILKKAAETLKAAFRSIDYVCRIGGDEFAVIMVEMTRELYYTIQEKIVEINRLLASPEDGLPPVSLSVGVAFSGGSGGKEQLFRAADSALYATKRQGRGGCTLAPAAEEEAERPGGAAKKDRSWNGRLPLRREN